MDQFSRQPRIEMLFQQWCDNTITEEEVHELMQLLQEAGMYNELERLSSVIYFQQKAEPFFTPEQKRKMFLNIVRPPTTFGRRSILYLSGIAAGVAMLLGVSAYWFWSGRNQATAVAGNDIAAPTRSNGILRSETGNNIQFEMAKSGILTTQGEVTVFRHNDSTIAFEGKTNKPVSNTLMVSRGSKPIHLLLADGTSVLLNAASGITFPNAFTGNERTVSFYGEAYFEVKHDPAHPFIVKAGKSRVKVLGTNFNIRSYNDNEQTKITLIEGKVNVNDKIVLKPGEQAIVENDIPDLLQHPDMEEALAWKNNEFNFNGWDVPAILSMLSQWYNFTIEYKTKIPTGHFSGSIKRDNNLSQVLRILETGGLQFKIQKDKLIVF